MKNNGQITKLTDIADIIMGQSPPSSSYSSGDKGVLFLQGKAEFGDTNPVTKQRTSQPLKIAEKHDILISVRAPVGDVNIADQKYCIGRGLAAIRAKKNVNPGFLFYFLKTTKDLLVTESGGSTFKSINRNSLENILMPLIDSPEEEKIVYILDTIQESIKIQNEVIDKTKELKAALMQKLFTKGTKGEKLKDSEIGKIPESWEIYRIQDLADVRGGKRLPKGHKFSINPTKNSYLRVVDFKNGSINKSHLMFLEEEDFDLLKNYSISSENVYISIAGTIGLTGVIPTDLDGSILTENAAKLVIRNRTVKNKFLALYLSTFIGQEQIKRQTSKSTQPKLALVRIKQILVPLPEELEQKEIIDIFSTIDQKIELEQKKRDLYQELFEAMLDKLMSGEISVDKVDFN